MYLKCAMWLSRCYILGIVHDITSYQSLSTGGWVFAFQGTILHDQNQFYSQTQSDSPHPSATINFETPEIEKICWIET